MPGETLLDILDTDPPKGNSIFFHETSCNSYKHGKIVITKREACAVESAAKLNSNRSVYVLFTSPGILRYEGTESDNVIRSLLTYNNVHLLHVNIDNYTRNTPIENLYEEGHLEYSYYAQSHMSDLLRYLTLWKYGGIYLDLDVIVIRPFTKLSQNFAGAESERDVAAGVLSFSNDEKGHSFATACLHDLKSSYRYNDWGHNGPGVITSSISFACCHLHLLNLPNFFDKMPFSSEEKRDMLEIYYASHRNVQVTSETYLQRYPERQQPGQTYFPLLHRNLGDFGSFCKPRKYDARPPHENEVDILQRVPKNLAQNK
ncbi:lactosylceramide 4-alpha-galactosyltransferase alpha- 14-galactosyltransferase [Holotrichia oblita]|uniref:Lactosylceramide 4-alpha-galactosyltransferase alpha- 14-galactosyltransferase n=1 Tax=Holotrichia oblita TaxID=644536 RepID=A0ACB9SQA8_HOLOL|nr:lactosylceramide 4-alpha-galactosyltransferase alpha- 14-galactosyltransferase [Holotrichia oblita]